MARAVVMVFDSNEMAERFVEENEVAGLFVIPTKFCPSTGAGGCDQGKRYRSWVRGKKYGWWVCAVCKLPAKLSGEKIWRHVLSQGVNLLTPSDDFSHLASVDDRGWGPSGRQ